MKKMLSAALLVMAVSVVGGCGGGVSGESTSGNAVARSASCFSTSHVGACHSGGSLKGDSQVTHLPIVAEWQASIHYKNNVAGCVDCHEADSNHYCAKCHGGLSREPVKNPDAAGKCGKCHGLNHPQDRMIARSPQHFGEFSSHNNRFSNRDRASYVSGQYQGNCRKCHNPHNPSTSFAYARAWAESGHGDTLAGSRTSRDFKMFGTDRPANLAYTNSSPPAAAGNSNIFNGMEFTPVCVRCHTTTGYLNFIQSAGFLDVRAFGNDPAGPYRDMTKEVTACNACHQDYSYARRPVPPVTLYFNFSGTNKALPGFDVTKSVKLINNPVTFPDLGSSNRCIPCHSGRGVGDNITQLADLGMDFSNATSPSAHDFAGAGLLTAKVGYEFAGLDYTTGTGSVTHHEDSSGGSDRGPCIRCHMDTAEPARSHHFLPVEHGAAFALYTANRTWSQVFSVSAGSPASLVVTEIVSRSCSTFSCHAGSGSKPMSATDLTGYKEGYISSLTALNKFLRLVRNVPVNPSLPFNSTTNRARSSTKWDYMGPGTGPNTMGASFNNSLLANEPGAYTHRPLYAKRLVYDSIAWLMQAQGQTNVADAIQWLVTTNATTLETVNGVPNTAVVARIPQHQADAAIKWLYGKERTSLTGADKAKRPGE